MFPAHAGMIRIRAIVLRQSGSTVVFPAHAGMIRSFSSSGTKLDCAATVFPAHAGMIRSS